MTFNEMLTKIRGMAEKIDASGRDFLAVQINLIGNDGSDQFQ